MGMAASQSRLLQLTCRKNDIGYELTRLANDKVSLTRDMQKVSKNYHNALSQKTLKWSNNSGVSYIDLSYNNLMKPSAMNNYEPYILTDTNDRVVISTNYEKYAKMLSPNGLPGGNWNSIRSQTIEELTGIDAERIDAVDASNEAVKTLEQKVYEIRDKEPTASSAFKITSFEDIIEKLGDDIQLPADKKDGTTSFKDAYNNNSVIHIGNKDGGKKDNEGERCADQIFADLMDGIAASLNKYFPDNQEGFDKAIESIKSNYLSLINNNTVLANESGAVYGDPTEKHAGSTKEMDEQEGNYRNGYRLNVRALLGEIEGALMANGCETHVNSNTGVASCVWYDVDNGQYQEWLQKHDAWKQEYQAAKEEYQAEVTNNAQLLTAEERSLIAFYDKIFSTIADKGWTRNKQVEDTNYLNQMLQNNLYTITTAKQEEVHNYFSGKTETKNVYSTDLASNFSKIFSVNDAEMREEALSIYEHEKSIINEKESRVDVRMKNLETEQSAINQMLQGLEQVKKNNIERTFNITG